VAKTIWQKSLEETFSQLTGFSPPQKRYKIGALLITLTNPFWVTVKEGYLDAAKEFGVQIDVLTAPTEGDLAAQLATLESMVAKDYDAIVVHTITAHNLIPGIVKATKRGIPVIDPDGRVDRKAVEEAGGKVIQAHTLDFYEQGKMGAQFIVEQLKPEGGKVAIIEGLPGAPQSEARRDGAKDVFEAEPTIDLVAVQAGDWDRTKALDIATNIIQAHPDIRGFYCANDVMALAVAEAVAAAKKEGQVIIVGTDFIADAKEAIKDGRIHASVAFSPYMYGQLGARMAIMAIEGKPIPEGVHAINVLVSKDNVAEMEDWK